MIIWGRFHAIFSGIFDIVFGFVGMGIGITR